MSYILPETLNGFRIPEILRDEEKIPLTEEKYSPYYLIDHNQQKELMEFVEKSDDIPEEEWRKWDENVLSDFSHAGNLAVRVLQNSKIIES